jgi:polar amino acid transport system substrate-binding protein
MEQLVQQLKDGRMELLEVPYPVVGPNQVLVRNHYSLISIGTERNTVKDARAGYLAKARSRQDEVKKVVKAAKTYGIKNTYDMVMNKLESPSSLGYSCAGEVIAFGQQVKGIEVGDIVACGGASAVHAEVVSVPMNLIAKVGHKTLAEHAAFTTVGAIAMQGVRQADLKIGESCVIIGLGLLGLLTAQLLHASGVKVIGIDLEQSKIDLAKSIGFEHCYLRSDEAIEQKILRLTDGHGVDASIITAGTSSTDPVNFAGQIARHKGKVVIVGNVSTDFKRKAFYRKELDLVMSCSYGPGRYDKEYEERGLDYPIGYVRWTEQRNMQAFLNLIDEGRIHLDPLVTTIIDFDKATSAYDMIMENPQHLTGVLLKYDSQKEINKNIKIRDARYADARFQALGG